jgi:hypothetical protein
MTQETMILEYLKAGNTITPLDALRLFNTMRLGARCYDLKRQGYPVKSRMIKNNGKHYAEYYLAEQNT